MIVELLRILSNQSAILICIKMCYKKSRKQVRGSKFWYQKVLVYCMYFILYVCFEIAGLSQLLACRCADLTLRQYYIVLGWARFAALVVLFTEILFWTKFWTEFWRTVGEFWILWEVVIVWGFIVICFWTAKFQNTPCVIVIVCVFPVLQE